MSKNEKQRRSRKKKAHKTSERFGEFIEHHGEKSASEEDEGIKSNYLAVKFLHFLCVRLLKCPDFRAVFQKKKQKKQKTELNTGSWFF